MNKVLYIMMLILFMATTMSSAGHRDDDRLPAAAPHLQLDSAYLDIGVIPRDSIGEGIIRFRNSGDAPLLIIKVFSECGCAVPEYSSEEVLPDGIGEIMVRYNSRNRYPGPFRKALRIRSNADNPREVLIIKGTVAP